MTPALLVAALGLGLGLAFGAPHPDPRLDPHWTLWKSRHHKSYHQREEGWRRAVWEENLRKIEVHNLEHSLGRTTFRLAINQFGDMTTEEFAATMNGYKAARGVGASAFLKPNSVEPPRAVDWRHHGYVTPVKDQGYCGSCWAFSATGALEGQTFRKTGRLVSLSEQNLVDCSGPQGNHGCDGGLPDLAFQYVRDNGGIDSEEAYPYTAEDGLCRYKPESAAANDTGLVAIPSGSEEALRQAVATVGPVSVAIDASVDSFRFYESGVYYEPECSNSESELDHAVLAVGYGQDKDGDKYWIVKNSWGETWGDRGYILMARDRDNNCGIATGASFPLV
ncbi:procathepsin L-like [Tachyglossus aculeatus]|uniref:procathepsin L-like n=1 Tax=Tachyglossus aculeatus TaxID=9261 RepID=UPI0018F45995|nr:procathepsin L-like [Tachyglossus aculeatus]